MSEETKNLVHEIERAARWLGLRGDRATMPPAPELTDAQWHQAHYQRFLRTRWYREGRTFEWWLKRRRKLRRITKQQQRKAAL